MRRLQRPLDPNAVKAANAALMAETGGRQLTMEPEDGELREKWVDAYLAAGGKEVKDFNSKPVKKPVEACPTNKWIELRYLHCDGTPVKKAKFNIKSPEYSKSGTLDENGFIHIDGVPDTVGDFQYWFEKDPEDYKPKPPEISTASGKPKEAATSALDDIGNWIWGTVQGDFNKDQSVSQIAVNMVLGFIPLVDQALDVRDIIAGLKDIIEFYSEDESKQKEHEDVLGMSYEVWIWISVFIIALGAIPELGSAIKGVLKTIIKYLGDALKKTGKLSPGQLRRIWEELLKVLNHLAIKQGNAHQFLKDLPGKLGKWMDEAAVKIKAALNSISYMLNKAEEFANRLSGTILSNEKAKQIIERVAKYRKAIGKAFERLEDMKRKVNEWISEKIKEILGGKHNFEKQGDPLKNAEKSGTNVRKQEEAAVPDAKRLAALDTKFGKPNTPVRPGTTDGVKPFEKSPNGKVIKNSSLQEVGPGKPPNLDPSKEYIWVIDKDGKFLVAEELPVGTAPDGFKQKLGHPTLTEGEPARIGGEFRYKDGKWEMNNKSGRYSNHPDRGPEQLENAANIVKESGMDVNTKFINLGG
jgi:hypothetical protein